MVLEMAYTSKPPIFELESFQYIYQLCAKKKLPVIPDFVSLKLQMVLRLCLVYESKLRGSAGEVLQVLSPTLTTLISQGFKHFSAHEIAVAKFKYNLNDFEFFEVIMCWIAVNKPSLDDVTYLWQKIRQMELENYPYLALAGGYITELVYRDRVQLAKVYLLPLYKFRCGIQERVWKLSPEMKLRLQRKASLSFLIWCKKCKLYGKYTNYEVNFSLGDNIPCSKVKIWKTGIFVEHCYLRLSGSEKPFSLVTNDYSTVMAKIQDTRSVSICLMYKCKSALCVGSSLRRRAPQAKLKLTKSPTAGTFKEK